MACEEIGYVGERICYLIAGLDPLQETFRLAGFLRMSPRDWTLRELFWLAQGAWEEERKRLLLQRWSIWGDQPATERQWWLFVETGEPIGGETRDARAVSPGTQAAVEAKLAEARANGGKLIVE